MITLRDRQRLGEQVRRWERTPQRPHKYFSRRRFGTAMWIGVTKGAIDHNDFGDVWTMELLTSDGLSQTRRAYNMGMFVDSASIVVLANCAMQFGGSQWVIVHAFTWSRIEDGSGATIGPASSNPQGNTVGDTIDWYSDRAPAFSAIEIYNYCTNLTLADSQFRVHLYWDDTASETRLMLYSADCPP